jgi:hypothetical protein
MTPVSALQQRFEADVATFRSFVETRKGLWLGKPSQREIDVLVASVAQKTTEVREKLERAALGGPMTASPELDQIGLTFTAFVQASTQRILQLATANMATSGEFTQMTTGAGIRPGTVSRDTATAETAQVRVANTTQQTAGDVVVTDEGADGESGGEESGARVSPAPGGFNPLWLILAGVALGAIAISAARRGG